MERNRTLALAHLWTAFTVFFAAIVLGVWQMLMRSPLPAPFDRPNAYYASVTAHGSIMAYVFPTLFAMGFGYAIADSAREGRMTGRRAAWIGYFLLLCGFLMAVIPIGMGQASVLYTFYPTLIGSPCYYLGITLVLVGSYV